MASPAGYSRCNAIPSLTKTLANYAQLIFECFALEHVKAGASEVHLIFDKPGQQLLTLNNLNMQKGTAHRKCHCNTSTFPSHQKQLYHRLGCRVCKRSIIEGIGLTFLKQGSYMVRPGQKLVLAGCFSGSSQGECSAWLVQATEVSIIPSNMQRSFVAIAAFTHSA